MLKHFLALATFFLLFGVLAWHFGRSSFDGIDLNTAGRSGQDRRGAVVLTSVRPRDASTSLSGIQASDAESAAQAELRSPRDPDDLALQAGERRAADGAGAGLPQRIVRRPATPPRREVYVRHYPGGQKQVEGERRYGRREGVWTEWSENGVVQSRGEYRDDQRVGVWQFYHENGELAREGLYVDGRMDGVWVAWHENGRPIREGRLQLGEPVDVWTEWYSNGQVRETGRYERGRREDYWKFFDFDGRADLRRTGHYRNGRRIR